MRTLEGQVAVVTGAARGIGRAYALHLASLGADVVVMDVNLEAAQEFGEKLSAPTVMDEIRALDRESLGVQVDVSQRDSVFDAFEQVRQTFGRIDVLVANAGGYAGDPQRSWASGVPDEDLRATIDRNLYGTIYSCQAVVGIMKEANYGRIVTVSSQAGLKGSPNGYYAAYGVAKAGIIQYTRYLAPELASFGIRVNCIAPAFIETKRLATWVYDKEDNRSAITASIPLGRIGTPEDCCKVIEFLVTDLSDYITGQCISVCGGVINF